MSLVALKSWASQSATSLLDWAASGTANGEERHHGSPHLPDEIILSILEYLPPRPASAQAVLAAVCLVNRSWYDVALPLLYRAPYITGQNYNLFVRTVCPSINAHVRRSDLAELVRKLDLTRLAHHSTKSLTARLLGRTKVNMEVFRAPAASFGLSCFAALSKCSRLTTLDLSWVNDAIRMHSLAHAVKNLSLLERLAFPRSQMREEDFDAANFVFPPSFRTLHLSGSITDDFLLQLTKSLVRTFTKPCLSLAISHCPELSTVGVDSAIIHLTDVLVSLKITDLPNVYWGGLSSAMTRPRFLEELSIGFDYIDFHLVLMYFLSPSQVSLPDVMADDYLQTVVELLKLQEADGAVTCPLVLKSLELIGPARPAASFGRSLLPQALLPAMKYGGLKSLRHIFISRDCGWKQSAHAADLTELVDYLDELAEEEGDFVELTEIGRREIGLFMSDT